MATVSSRDASPDHLADAIGRTVDHRAVDTDGAANTAEIIAELLQHH